MTDTGLSIVTTTETEPEPLETRWSPGRFKTAHAEIARLSVAGLEAAEIAARTGYAVGSVSAILASAQARDYIRSLTEPLQEAATELHMQVQAGAVLAYATQLQLMLDGSTPAATRAAIAKDTMDRGGPMRKEGHVSALISSDRLDELRNMIGASSNED